MTHKSPVAGEPGGGATSPGSYPDVGTVIPQRTPHYPTLPGDIAERAQARGLDIEQSTDRFLDRIRTRRGMRRDLLARMGVLMTERSRVQQVDDAYLRTVLTGREMDVLLAMADGDTNQDIAEELGISTETVKGVIVAIYRKLLARNRAHAVALAYHLGILEARRAA